MLTLVLKFWIINSNVNGYTYFIYTLVSHKFCLFYEHVCCQTYLSRQGLNSIDSEQNITRLNRKTHNLPSGWNEAYFAA